MNRIIRASVVVASITAAAVLAGPAPAHAEPAPGSVTATFTDVCGFVQAEFTNADPDIPDAAFIRFSRDGKQLDSFGEQINGGASATLYQVAADGDQIHYEWDVEGGTTESLDHTHVTPGGCDEPKLAVSLIDSCGPDFTVSVANSGTGPAAVVIRAPTLHNAPYTVPAGGSVKVTVPGVAVSGAWVGRTEPDGSGTAVVDALQRASGCGIPWPNDQLITYTRTCDKVSFILYALDMKGTVFVRRNGSVVLEQNVDLDIYKFSVTVKRNDVVVVGDSPPLLTYTHKPPASCTPPVAPAVAPPSTAARTASPSPSALPVATVGDVPLSPSPSLLPRAAAGPPGGAAPPEVDGTPVALITMGSAFTLLVLGSAGWFLIAALRRRRQPVWAVAFGNIAPQPSVRDIGVIPTTSLRWVAHPGSTAHYLREDGSS